ncbi:hypothetical protein IG631_10169 [Alternaria alternata]|nr:hypothetical protein IG631_10169 [Alternaria alternata]
MHVVNTCHSHPRMHMHISFTPPPAVCSRHSVSGKRPTYKRAALPGLVSHNAGFRSPESPAVSLIVA